MFNPTTSTSTFDTAITDDTDIIFPTEEELAEIDAEIEEEQEAEANGYTLAQYRAMRDTSDFDDWSDTQQ